MDRTYEEVHRHRASGFNLVFASIILWNTVDLGRGANATQAQRIKFDEQPSSMLD